MKSCHLQQHRWPRDYQTKWSKTDRERQISYDITYMWNLNYDTNEFIYKTEVASQAENKLMGTQEERGWRQDKSGAWD